MTQNFRSRTIRPGAESRTKLARLDSILLSSVGALAAHQVAYSIAPLLGQKTLVGHGHLSLVWKVSLLAAVLGMTGLVLRSLRTRHHKIANPFCMGTAMATSFASLELVERVVEGIAPSKLATEPVFWLGLAATIPITAVYTFVLRAVSEVANKFFDHQSLPDWTSTSSSGPHAEYLFSLGHFDHSWSLWSRGPPVRG